MGCLPRAKLGSKQHSGGGTEAEQTNSAFPETGNSILKAKQSKANSERLTWPADVEGRRLPPAARAEELKRLDGTVNCS